jgi:DNA-binding transcriptional regulator GbsR (MarR family)
MSTARDGVVAVVEQEHGWAQLTTLENLHREIQRNHERVLRNLDEVSTSEDRRGLQFAWNQYKSVVAELSRVTEEMESLRLTMG